MVTLAGRGRLGGRARGPGAIFASFDTNTRVGRLAEVTEDFTRLTGRAPEKYGDWLAANQAALAG